MKKLILTCFAVMAFAFSPLSDPCNSYSTQVITSCGSYCIGVRVELSGSLEADATTYNSTGGTMLRKPSLTELMEIHEQLEDLC